MVRIEGRNIAPHFAREVDMATLTAGPKGIDMTVTALNPSPVASDTLTSGSLTFVYQDGEEAIYTGSFSIYYGSVSGGTATGLDFTHKDGATPRFLLSNVSISASDAVSFANAHDFVDLILKYFTGNDTYIGSAAGDILRGLGGNDTFVGGSGTEFFMPSKGNNTITGGSGIDTVDFGGPRSAYTFTDNGDGSITVTDSVPTRNGTDHIAHVGFLQFTDKQVIVATPPQADIARLYSAALNRAPDPPGLVGWENIYITGVPDSVKGQGPFVALSETNPAGLTFSIAGGFTNSTEFQQKYGVLDDTGFVTQLYQNVLNRAPDAAGLNGWLNLMHNGDSTGLHYTRPMVLVGFAESPENIAKTAGDWLFVV